MRRWIESLNFKFLYLHRSFGNSTFRLLDVGSGNHSASKTCRVFPLCDYYGIDKEKTYNNSEEDFRAIKGFYETDLEQLEFATIPDNYFDALWMVHVIEHLHDGDEVIAALLPKLKKGGFIFIEYPGKKSLQLPSMYGTLNFHDDPRMYDYIQLLNWKICSVKRAAPFYGQAPGATGLIFFCYRLEFFNHCIPIKK